ncbi:MAG: hypothetical protein ABII75_02335, partial [Candidatus Omnitrophota bacterium]
PLAFLFYLFVAHGIMNINKKLLKIPLCLFLAFGISGSLMNYYKGDLSGASWDETYHMGVHKKRDYKEALRFIENNMRDGDILASADMQAQLIARIHFKPYSYLNKKLRLIRFFIPKYNIDPLWQIRRVHYLQRGTPLRMNDYVNEYTLYFTSTEGELLKAAELKSKRIWLISSCWDDGWGAETTVESARQYLKLKYKVIYSLRKENMFIELYEFIEREDIKS